MTSQGRGAPDSMSVPCLPRRRTLDAPRTTGGHAVRTADPAPSGGGNEEFRRCRAVECRDFHSSATDHRCGTFRHGHITSGGLADRIRSARPGRHLERSATRGCARTTLGTVLGARLHRAWEEPQGLDTHLGSDRPKVLCPDDRSRVERAWNDAVLDITTEWEPDELVCSTSEQLWVALPLMIAGRPDGALRSAFTAPRDAWDGSAGLPCSTASPTPRSGRLRTGTPQILRTTQ